MRSATSSAPIRWRTCRSAACCRALDLPRDLFCFACFDGQYPVPVPYDVASHKFVLEDEPAATALAGSAAIRDGLSAGGRRCRGRRARRRAACASDVEGTFGPEVLGGLGGFGGALGLPGGLREPVLVSRPTASAPRPRSLAPLGRFDTIGLDLVAMCADDVVCHGARPLFFLDYIAVGQRRPGAGRGARGRRRRRLRAWPVARSSAARRPSIPACMAAGRVRPGRASASASWSATSSSTAAGIGRATRSRHRRERPPCERLSRWSQARRRSRARSLAAPFSAAAATLGDELLTPTTHLRARTCSRCRDEAAAGAA